MSLLPRTGVCTSCGHDHGNGLGSPGWPSTLGQQVAAAQAEMATWSPEKRASVRLEGGDSVGQPVAPELTDHDEAVLLLSAVFDAWENGDDCHEEGDPDGTYMGKCFQLDDDVFKRCCGLLNRLNPPRNAPAYSNEDARILRLQLENLLANPAPMPMMPKDVFDAAAVANREAANKAKAALAVVANRPTTASPVAPVSALTDEQIHAVFRKHLGHGAFPKEMAAARAILAATKAQPVKVDALIAEDDALRAWSNSLPIDKPATEREIIAFREGFCRSSEATAQPVEQVSENKRDAEPNMLWEADDTEDGTYGDSPDEFARNYADHCMLPGDCSEVEVQCAIRSPLRTMKIAVAADVPETENHQIVTWEWIASTPPQAIQTQEKK